MIRARLLAAVTLIAAVPAVASPRAHAFAGGRGVPGDRAGAPSAGAPEPSSPPSHAAPMDKATAAAAARVPEAPPAGPVSPPAAPVSPPAPPPPQPGPGEEARAPEPTLASSEPPSDPPPDPASEPSSEPASDEALAPFRDPEFGPRYTIEKVIVRGNRKTATALIVGELGIRAGDALTASDGRVEAARIHLLSLGFFLDVRLALKKGAARGGANLIVEVEERGTIILNALYYGTSRATPFWGGLDIAETNLGGRGISLGAGFVAASRPQVTESTRELGARVRAQVPPLFGTGLTLSGTGILLTGDELYRVSGADSDNDPQRFVALGLRRVGGVVGMGRALTSFARFFVDFREEGVTATWPTERTRLLPDGTAQPIDFGIHQGFSRVGSVTGTLDIDTRSDPLVPRAGIHVALSAEGAIENLGSSYQFAKLVFQGSSYTPVRRGHIFGIHLFAGALFGEAPLFDRFYVGDMNLLLPPRALGLSFSTQPSPNLLGSAIAGHRYDNFAARVMFEYAVPLWRRHAFVYSGDAFVALGAFAMGSSGNFRDPTRSGLSAWPIDVTGDLGVRLDTQIGVFTLSIANALGRVPL